MLAVAALLVVLLALVGPSLPGGNPLAGLGRWMAGGFGGGYR